MVTNNAIALTTAGITGYDGAGNFTGTAVTAHNIIVGGATSQVLVNVAPSATAGVPVVSAGASSNPTFGTAVVAGGGTGLTTLTAFQLIAAGTTSTGNLQQIGLGNANQILTSNGAGALSSFQTLPVISSWVVQGGSVTGAASTGYLVNNNTAAITLPTAQTTGTTISIYNDVGASVVVNAGTAQTIRIAAGTSTSGGTATSAAQGDCLTLVFRSATSTWNAVSSEGTWVLA